MSRLLYHVQKQLNNIDSVDLYNFLKGQPTNDRLLNHLLDEQMGDVDPVKFKNKLTQAMDVNAELKKFAMSNMDVFTDLMN